MLSLYFTRAQNISETRPINSKFTIPLKLRYRFPSLHFHQHLTHDIACERNNRALKLKIGTLLCFLVKDCLFAEIKNLQTLEVRSLNIARQY